MATKQYDNYADLITFTRASTGTALRHVGYGSELITNGTFDTDLTGWSQTGSDFTWSSGGASGVATGGTATTLHQIATTEVGKVYKFDFTISGIANLQGSDAFASIRSSGPNAGAENVNQDIIVIGNGSHSFAFVATSATSYVSFKFTSISEAGDAFTVDNVSVKEVIFDRATDPLVLFNHPTNVPRIEYDANGNRKGLLIEEARTNRIRNSVAGGAVVGSPGSLPTYWAVFGGTAATEIVATGTEAGVAYVDVRITGNPATGIFNFESSTQILASEGESWSLNLNARIVAGDTTNVNELRPSINWRSSGAFLSRVTGEDFKDETNAGPRIVSGTAPATTDRVLPQIFVSCSGDVDFTLRVYAPQLEAGSFPTSYISTSGAAASRSADVASIPTSAFGYNADKGTVVCEFEYQYATSGGFPRPWEIGSTSTAINRINMFTSFSTGNFVAAAVSNNVTAASLNLLLAAPSPVGGKAAFAFAEDDFAACIDGGSVLTDTSGTMVPSVPRNALTVGGATTATSQNINGHIKSIQYYPRRLSNAQLQRLTA
jgi:hypothetical protein